MVVVGLGRLRGSLAVVGEQETKQLPRGLAWVWGGMGAWGWVVWCGGNLGRRACKAGRCKTGSSLQEGFTAEWLSQLQSSTTAALSPQKYLVFGSFPEAHHTESTLGFSTV